jgi:hypothetical protein
MHAVTTQESYRRNLGPDMLFVLLFSSLFQSLGMNGRERLPTALYDCGFPRNPHALVLFKKSSSRRPFPSCFFFVLRYSVSCG